MNLLAKNDVLASSKAETLCQFNAPTLSLQYNFCHGVIYDPFIEGNFALMLSMKRKQMANLKG